MLLKHIFCVEILTANMNCLRCRHTHQVHEFKSKETESLLRVGKCLVPGCDCSQYVDKIEKIDEELL